MTFIIEIFMFQFYLCLFIIEIFGLLFIYFNVVLFCYYYYYYYLCNYQYWIFMFVKWLCL